MSIKIGTYVKVHSWNMPMSCGIENSIEDFYGYVMKVEGRDGYVIGIDRMVYHEAGWEEDELVELAENLGIEVDRFWYVQKGGKNRIEAVNKNYKDLTYINDLSIMK